jgi:hypothetical protein
VAGVYSTWAGIQKGQDVIVVEDYGPNRKPHRWNGKVVSLGPHWITVAEQVDRRRARKARFDRRSGCGEFRSRVHTAQSLEEAPRRAALERMMRNQSWNHYPMAVLEAAFAALLLEEERAQALQDALAATIADNRTEP